MQSFNLMLLPLFALVNILLPTTLASNGTFTTLTYNIAGLLEGISSAEIGRVEATKLISAYINDFDIVHVQEDFNYHEELYKGEATHQFRSSTTGGMGFGSGLNTLSRFPFPVLQRLRWEECCDFDCLTPKGFTLKEVEVAEDVIVHVYNLHIQAQSYELANIKRRKNWEQLIKFIDRNSDGFPTIVSGDFNSRYSRELDVEGLFDLIDLGFKDAWIENVRKPAGLEFTPVGQPTTCEKKDPDQTRPECEVVDKIFFRGNDFVTLNAAEFEIKGDTLTADNLLLSDHLPLFAEFEYETNPNFHMSKAVGGSEGGFAFNDINKISDNGSRIVKAEIAGGKRVFAVRLTYEDGTVVKHGGLNSFNKALTLEDGEKLVSVEICKDLSGWRTKSERVFFLSITTSLNNVIAAGKRSGSCETIEEVPGMDIVGFHGRSGSEIDKLGFIFRVSI